MAATAIMSDLRHAFRSLRRSPWYAAAVVAVSALGVALATTVFAVVDGVLFKPLPYARAWEVFGLSPSAANAPVTQALRPASVPDLRAWRNAVPQVQFSAFYSSGMKITLARTRIEVAFVDGSFFDVLGQKPLIGGFRSGDFGPAGRVWPVVISYRVWQHIFNGDLGVVGRTFVDDTAAAGAESSAQIVGILPPEFLFPSPAGVFKPEILRAMPAPSAQASVDAAAKSSYVIARVPANMPVADVERRLRDAAHEVGKLYPRYDPKRPWRVPYDVIRVVPIRAALTSIPRSLFRATFLSAAALMLLACVNIAGLASARRHDRRRELILRRALGASRTHLLRLAGLENGILIFSGTALGVVVATQLLKVVRTLLPSYVLLKTPEIDARVVAFCTITAVLSVGIVTLWPSADASGHESRSSFANVISTSHRRSRRRGLLIAAQVAIALALVIGGTLFLASLSRVFQENAGIQTDHAFRLELTTRGKPQDMTTISSLVAEVRSVYGVAAAGGVDHALLQQIIGENAFDAPPGTNDSDIESLPITAGFLEAAGLSAIDGRLPTDDELETGAAVIVVSRRAGERYWPGQRPVGQTLTRTGGSPFTVVGVVPDVRFRSLDVDPRGEVYWPMAAEPKPLLWNLYVRVMPGSEGAVASILNGIAAKFPAYNVLNVQTAAQSYGLSLRQRRLQAWLFGSFGLAALIIVGVGILGLLAMTTAQRTHEIGIRMALGSTPRRIITLLLREQFIPVLVGLVTGAVAAVWITRLASASLYHVNGGDVRVWTVSLASILLTAFLGTLLPALRASCVDPMIALRVD